MRSPPPGRTGFTPSGRRGRVPWAIVATTETTPCPVCETEETKTLYRAERFAMGRCTGCGLVRQDPRLTAEALRTEVYDGSTQRDGNIRGHEVDNAGLPYWQPKPMRAYEACVEAVDAVRGKGDRGVWLDIGASTGALLVAARAAGYTVGGAELGSEQVRICRDEHGFDVFHGTLLEAGFPAAHAAVISWRQVLEHIHDLHAELAEARRVLRDDGHLLIEVPHFGGTRYQFGRLRSALKLSRPFWERVNVPQHLYYFTIDSLRKLLAKAGFEVVHWETYGKYRTSPSWHQRMRAALRDGLKRGNKLRVIARKTT